MENLLTRITLNPAVSQGKPTLRNMRFTVAQLLELLAAGMTHEEILTDYTYLEEADIQAALLYAAHIANARTIIPLAVASWFIMLKFLVDTQLPPMLATYLQWKGFDSIHTTHFPNGHLLQDTEIRRIAITENRIIVTKDSDFPDSFFLKGPPPRVIYLRLGNTRNRELTAFLEMRWAIIEPLLTDGSGMVVLSQTQLISYWYSIIVMLTFLFLTSVFQKSWT